MGRSLLTKLGLDGGGISAIWGRTGGSNLCLTELQPTTVFSGQREGLFEWSPLILGASPQSLTNLENVICKVVSALVCTVSVMVAHGGWIFDKA